MKEINNRISFDNPKSPIEFINLNLIRKGLTYKFQCLMRDKRGLFEFCAIVDSAEELSDDEGRELIDQLQVEAMEYFESMSEEKHE